MLAALGLAAAVPAAAEGLSGANSFDGQWHFSVTPYAWLPTIYDSATINARAITDGVQSNSHFTPADYLSHLSFAFFLAGEARKGQVQLSDDGRWFMPYYADIGSGANNWTWMAMIGTGYRYDRGKVTVALRNE